MKNSYSIGECNGTVRPLHALSPPVFFAWIAALTAAEAELAGKKKTTPYWRTLKSKGN